MDLRHPTGFRRAQIGHNRAIHAHATAVVAHSAADVQPHDAINATPRPRGNATQTLGEKSLDAGTEFGTNHAEFILPVDHLFFSIAVCSFDSDRLPFFRQSSASPS